MAGKTISQRIALVGGEEIKKQLGAFGQAGEKAFADVQAAAEKLKGPGAEFARRMDAAQQKIRQLGDAVTNVGRSMRNLGAGLSVAVTAPLTLMAKKGLDAWKVQEEAIKRVEAALLSTGGTVGLTSEELQKLAGDLQKVTTVGDEATLAMQAVLLTFTNIRGDQFKEANVAILNLSAALGKDLQSSAQMVGKALNDPAKGLAALSRLGIKFTEDQKRMVKQLQETGKVAKAQEVILAALNTQFGGMAEALAKTPHGQYQQALNNLGDVWEEIGRVLTPVLVRVAQITQAFADLLLVGVQAFSSLPGAVQDLAITLGMLAAAAGPVLLALGMITMGLGSLAGGFASLLPALVSGGAMIASIGTAAMSILGALASLVGWPVLFAAAMALLVVQVIEHRDAIAAAVAKMVQSITSAVRAAWQAIPEGLAEAGEAIREAFKDALDYVWSRFTWLGDKISEFVSGVTARIQTLLGLVGQAENRANSAESGTGPRGYAGGGSVHGPGTGTSDSILARLSNGEFVMKAQAVRHYGADLFRRLNSMQLPGFASGGLASSSSVPVSDAGAGASGLAGAYALLNLKIGGESFGGLMAPRETADRLVRFALQEETKSAGRRPGWYRGGA